MYLHVFANASIKAHGAVAHIGSAEQVNFVMLKSCVLPLKDITLSRLELHAAVTASHLAEFIVSILQIQFRDVSIRLWSHSHIALHWIISKEQLKPFVANCVIEGNLFLVSCFSIG